MSALNEELLAGMEDDALATIAVEMKEEGRKLTRMAGLAHQELTNRLRQRNATKLDTESWTGTMRSTGYTHEIERPEALMDALTLAGVDTDTIDRAFPLPEPKRGINHTVLNELAKLGGDVAATIERYRVSRPNDRVLELKKKTAEEVRA